MLNWTKERNLLEFGWRLVLLMVGLFLFAAAIVIILKADLGLGSWDVLHKGLSIHTPLSFGQAGQFTGLLIILFSLLLGVKPGIGTIANMIFIGFWIDTLGNANIIPAAQPIGGFPAQLLWVIAGILILGFGSGLYIKAGLGAGPRDSFMLALVKRTGWRVSICRAIIEVTVCLVGWLLGGPVGIATLLFAFGVGPSVELAFRLLRVEISRSKITPPASETSAKPVI